MCKNHISQRRSKDDKQTLSIHNHYQKQFPLFVHAWYAQSAGYYLIFKTAILKVKLPVGFPIKQMAQFCVASVPLTPWVTVYCHPIRSSAWIEMIMYSVALICKSYSFFSDSAVIVLVKNSIPGRLLFYKRKRHYKKA